MGDCVFCKILQGKLPSTKVYEDEFVIGIVPLKQEAEKHYLIIPKKHTKNITEMNMNELSNIMQCIVKAAKELNLESYRIINNCGQGAGQTVFHTHFHILSDKRLAEEI